MLLPRRSILPAFVALFVVLSVSNGFSQDESATDPSFQQGQGSLEPSVPALVPATPRDPSRTIHLDIVVAPSAGATPVAGLQQSDFVIRDNNVIQNIHTFRAASGADAQVELVLVIDAVNMYYERVPYVRQQVSQFLRSSGGKLAHPTAIAIFTDAGMQMQPKYSTDGNALADFTDHVTIPLRSVGRSAGFYGADERFQKSIRGLNTLTARLAGDPGRKLVLWISPGWPLLSGPRTSLGKRSQQNLFDSVVALSAQLRSAGVTLYNISPLFGGDTERTFYYQAFLKPVEKPSKVQIANLSLQVLAAQSGGLVLNSSNDVAGYLRAAAADADAYYEISFEPQPPAAPGVAYHSVHVSLTRPGLTARARQGYYSQP